MKNSILIFAIFFAIFSCGVVGEKDKGTLTDQDVQNYIKAYKALKEQAPGILEQVNKNKGNEQIGKDQFGNIEKTIKDAGIADYPTFVKLNVKIGAIFSIAQGEKGMNQFSKMKTDGNQQIADAIKMYDSLIADPNTPENAKAEFRKAKEQMNAANQQINQDWEKNKKWADLVMDKTKKLTNIFVNEKDIEVVMKHEKEIMEAYTGFAMPEYDVQP